MGPVGYAWGQVVPNRWHVQTANAEFPFDWLNDGELLFLQAWDLRTLRYFGFAHQFLLDKIGWDEETGFPLGVSVLYQVEIQEPGEPAYRGERLVDWPPAIEEFSISVEPAGGGENLIPQPLDFSPRRWNEPF